MDYARELLKNEKILFIAGNHDYPQYIGKAWENMNYRMNSYMDIMDMGGLGVDMFFTSRMFGDVDKYMIGAEPDKLRTYLKELKKETDKGGYIPIPDHHIPPQISLKQMRTYIEISHEIFG